MIRSWIDSAPEADRGWLAALRDEQVGRYLTHWRMRLARTLLRETSEPLAAHAGRLGYQSEAAFCRAFKRVFGVPPGSVRHADAARPLAAAH